MADEEQFDGSFLRSDSEFLRSMGIETDVFDDPCPEVFPQRYSTAPHVRLTKKDAEWLKQCGVAWEREPEVQLPLGFCGREGPAEET